MPIMYGNIILFAAPLTIILYQKYYYVYSSRLVPISVLHDYRPKMPLKYMYGLMHGSVQVAAYCKCTITIIICRLDRLESPRETLSSWLENFLLALASVMIIKGQEPRA